MRILFVCTGNTCRSPMAELFFRDEITRRRLPDVEVCSAGIGAFPNSPISDGAFAVMAKLGIDGSSFRSTRLSLPLLDSCDRIIAMGSSHRDAICRSVPEYSSRISLLLDETVGGDVPDPFGGTETEYQNVFETMKPALLKLIDKIIENKDQRIY